jgi:hypothetical protein
MFTTYVIVTIVAATVNLWAASNDFTRAEWVLDNMTRLGVSHSQLAPLGALKIAGAIGLLVGIAVPPVGIAAATGLVLFFVGAIVTVLRARWYAHFYPIPFLLLAAAALALRLVTL